MAAVVKNTAFPIWMKTFLLVLVLVEMGAVKKSQAVLVSWKMRGDPIKDDPNALLMKIIDQVHKILRGAIAAGWGKKARDLVAPGTIKGMFHHRHKLNVCEPHFLNILS